MTPPHCSSNKLTWFGMIWLVVLDLVGFDCVSLAGCVGVVSKALCGMLLNGDDERLP